MLTKVLETKYENNFHQFNVGDPVVITITGVYVGYNHFQNKCIIKPDLHQLYNKTEIIDQLVEMDLKFVKHAPKTDPKQALIIPSLTDNVSLNEETNVDEIKNDESLSDIINNPFDIVQSVDNVNELGEITIDFKVPDELGDDEKATETLAGIQERMLRKLITKDRIEQLEYDDDKIPLIVKCIKSMCTCGHGTRTLGCCAHRTTIWQLLRDSLRGNNMEEPHTDCTAQGNILINIENDHEWIRAEPKGLNSDTEDDGYDGNRSRFRNHNNP
eukprot:448805_1